MEGIIIEIIGYLAMFCTSSSFIPQVVQIYKTKSTQDISLSMYIIYTLGIILWLIYTIWIKALPLIIGNVISLVLVSIILTMKYVWRKQKGFSFYLSSKN